MLTIFDNNGNKFTFFNANYVQSYESGYTDYYTNSEKKTWVARLNANGTLMLTAAATYSVEKATFSNLEELEKELKNEQQRGKLSTYRLARLKNILRLFDGKQHKWRSDSQTVINHKF